MKKLRPHQIVSINAPWQYDDGILRWWYLYHLCVVEQVGTDKKYKVLGSFWTTATAYRFKKKIGFDNHKISVRYFVPDRPKFDEV